MNWLWQNKEWVFSGIGVFLLSVIWAAVRHARRPKTPTVPQQPAAQNQTASGAPTIHVILRDIDSRPPYQQDQTRQDYIGLRIRFSGEFTHLSKEKNEIVWVWVEDPKERYPNVHFEVPINDFPEFKTMQRGTPLTVEGALRRIDWMTTTLESVRIIRE